MSAVPRPRPTPISLYRPHSAALFAAAAYAAAAFGLYQLVAPALGREDAAPRSDIAAEPAALGLPLGPETLTLRALAGRAKTSTFVLEGAGGAHGSAFVAWVHPQDTTSFLITARSVVAGMLATGASQVYLKDGSRFWTARIFRDDPNTGLAVLRVGGVVFDRPLWQRPGDRAKPTPNQRIVVVPAGVEAPYGEGIVHASDGRFWVSTSADPIYLGAPVVSEDGRVAGVVVELGENGAQIAPLGAACRQVRYC